MPDIHPAHNQYKFMNWCNHLGCKSTFYGVGNKLHKISDHEKLH